MKQMLIYWPPEDRTLFQLRYPEGYSAAEPDELFDMPSAAVRTRLARMRQLQRELFL